MNRISELAMALIRISIMIIVPIMTVVVFAQVIMRYVFSAPFFWVEEFASYLLLWLSCLGAAYAVKTGENISVEVFKNIPLVIDVLTMIVTIIFFLITIFYAVQWCTSEWTQRSAAMGIRVTWIYMSIFVGFGLALFFLLEKLIRRLKGSFYQA